MKLRIKGNSLRIRLTRSELARLADTGRVDDAIQLGAGEEHRLGYAIAVADDLTSARVGHHSQQITVVVPREAVLRWLGPIEVGIDAMQDLGGGKSLAILLEKDFACLEARPGDENADAFANPAEGMKC